MARDFRANQIQTNKIIASGSTGTGAKLVFYSIEADDAGSPNQGNIDTGVFDTSQIGDDTFIYFSGSTGVLNTSRGGAAVFAGDVFISGNFDVAGALFDASASNVFNDSSVAGAFVDDALDNLATDIAESATDWTLGGPVNANLYTTSSVKISSSLDVQLAITASSITNGAQYNGVTVLTASVGIVNIDASAGPNYHLNLTGSWTIGNPSNAIAGQELVIGVRQDTFGEWTTTFATGWIPVGQLGEVNLSASSDSIISAVARDYDGGGVVWDYAITNGEEADGITDIEATLTTTGTLEKTIAIVPMSLVEDYGMGVIDVSIIAFSTGSTPANKTAQFGMRSTFMRSGSTITNLNENIYSSYKDDPDPAAFFVTHSIGVSTISIRVVGTSSADVDWKIKGIFQETP
jgi:hypothetical protein